MSALPRSLAAVLGPEPKLDLGEYITRQARCAADAAVREMLAEFTNAVARSTAQQADEVARILTPRLEGILAGFALENLEPQNGKVH
jgi:hypothetical protein